MTVWLTDSDSSDNDNDSNDSDSIDIVSNDSDSENDRDSDYNSYATVSGFFPNFFFENCKSTVFPLIFFWKL